jgi:2-oxoglutarate dehydrogenase E1 component
MIRMESSEKLQALLEEFGPNAGLVEELLYSATSEVVWVQEEPQNMGAWTFLQPRFTEQLRPNQRLSYVGRPASAATSTGSLKVHNADQEALVKKALG